MLNIGNCVMGKWCNFSLGCKEFEWECSDSPSKEHLFVIVPFYDFVFTVVRKIAGLSRADYMNIPECHIHNLWRWIYNFLLIRLRLKTWWTTRETQENMKLIFNFGLKFCRLSLIQISFIFIISSKTVLSFILLRYTHF